MKYLFLLSKENLKLSRYELDCRLKSTTHNNDISLTTDQIKRFDFFPNTHKVFKVIKLTTSKTILPDLQKINWNKQIKNDFKVSFEKEKQAATKTSCTQREVAKIIWNRLRKPKVNLNNPESEIVILIRKNKYYITKLHYENTDNFEARKAHKRPSLSPISLHPRLAKSMVAMTGIKSGSILDPCCGIGGHLIEASLLNLKPIGFDIDSEMISKTKLNLKHFKNQKYPTKLYNIDATKNNRKFNYIITDLPYGKNTKSFDVDQFYTDFFAMLDRSLKKTAIISFNDSVNYQKYLKKAKNLKRVTQFSHFIHRSLSKTIIVLKRI